MKPETRREQLLQGLDEPSVTYVFSGTAPMRSADESYPFTVNRNFYYLTGIDAENMALVMLKEKDVKRSVLFIEPYDELLARWVGGRMKEDEAKAISGVDEVRDIRELNDYFSSLYERRFRGMDMTLYTDMWRQQYDQRETDGIDFANSMRKHYPNLQVKDLFSHITSMRLVKDEEEVENIRKAIAVTKNGIEEMMRHIRPNMNELIMDATFDFTLKANGCKEHAFGTIAASGERATTLHYHDNDQTMLDGELFLCDLGAAHNHYCADISRTFPVNGYFTDRQKEIYNLVLEVQNRVTQAAKPGVSVRDLQQLVISFYQEELPKHGLNEPVSEYYFHGIGHHLGLDTHDVDGGLGAVLQVGNVLTNEPGLYIREEGIGIRIEDDLLITEDGAEVLSKDILKTPEEIEEFMHR